MRGARSVDQMRMRAAARARDMAQRVGDGTRHALADASALQLSGA